MNRVIGIHPQPAAVVVPAGGAAGSVVRGPERQRFRGPRPEGGLAVSEIKMTIVGNITKKPEIKTTNQGKLVTRLRVASTRKRYIEGRWIDGESAYIDVDCWEHLAQNVVNTFGKGDRIIAEGRLRTDQWEDNGVKKTFTKIVADSVGPDLRFAAAITRNRRERGPRRATRPEEEMMNGVSAAGVAEKAGRSASMVTETNRLTIGGPTAGRERPGHPRWPNGF